MKNNNVKNTEFEQTFVFKNLGESLKDFDVRFLLNSTKEERKFYRDWIKATPKEEQERIKKLYPWAFLKSCLFIGKSFGIIYGCIGYDTEKQIYYIDEDFGECLPIELSYEELNSIYWAWPDYDVLSNKVDNALQQH